MRKARVSESERIVGLVPPFVRLVLEDPLRKKLAEEEEKTAKMVSILQNIKDDPKLRRAEVEVKHYEEMHGKIEEERYLQFFRAKTKFDEETKTMSLILILDRFDGANKEALDILGYFDFKKGKVPTIKERKDWVIQLNQLASTVRLCLVRIRYLYSLQHNTKVLEVLQKFHDLELSTPLEGYLFGFELYHKICALQKDKDKDKRLLSPENYKTYLAKCKAHPFLLEKYPNPYSEQYKMLAKRYIETISGWDPIEVNMIIYDATIIMNPNVLSLTESEWRIVYYFLRDKPIIESYMKFLHIEISKDKEYDIGLISNVEKHLNSKMNYIEYIVSKSDIDALGRFRVDNLEYQKELNNLSVLKKQVKRETQKIPSEIKRFKEEAQIQFEKEYKEYEQEYKKAKKRIDDKIERVQSIEEEEGERLKLLAELELVNKNLESRYTDSVAELQLKRKESINTRRTILSATTKRIESDYKLADAKVKKQHVRLLESQNTVLPDMTLEELQYGGAELLFERKPYESHIDKDLSYCVSAVQASEMLRRKNLELYRQCWRTLLRLLRDAKVSPFSDKFISDRHKVYIGERIKLYINWYNYLGSLLNVKVDRKIIWELEQLSELGIKEGIFKKVDVSKDAKVEPTGGATGGRDVGSILDVDLASPVAQFDEGPPSGAQEILREEHAKVEPTGGATGGRDVGSILDVDLA